MKIGRNAPCPCGSGKKYKSCCLRLENANRGVPGGAAVRETAAKARTWQADLLPIAARFEDFPDALPAAAMVTAAGFVIFSKIHPRPSPEVDGIAEVLEASIHRAVEAIGSPPERISVREPEVAEALGARLRQAGLEVPVQAAALTELEEAMAAMNQAMGGRAEAILGTRPATWRGWGQSDEWIAELFRRCAAYYRARPWERFDDPPAILAETSTGGLWVLAILGSAGVEYGLGFYSHPEDYKSTLEGTFSSPVGRVLGLTFDGARDLERTTRKEVAAAGWEVASADAYPALMTIGCPAGGLRAADAADLVAILAAVTAFSAAVDEDGEILYQGPWIDSEDGVALQWAGAELERCDGDPGSSPRRIRRPAPDQEPAT